MLPQVKVIKSGCWVEFHTRERALDVARFLVANRIGYEMDENKIRIIECEVKSDL